MIKNIIFDVGDVLARPQTGHWFITPNFWNIIDKKFVDGTFQAYYSASDSATVANIISKEDMTNYTVFLKVKYTKN